MPSENYQIHKEMKIQARKQPRILYVFYKFFMFSTNSHSTNLPNWICYIRVNMYLFPLPLAIRLGGLNV